MNIPNFAMRHAHLLDGQWVYSCVTLSCGCSALVANPQRAITVDDPWYCCKHMSMVKIVRVEPATLAKQDALCQPASEYKEMIA